jgi:hypothetical protein
MVIISLDGPANVFYDNAAVVTNTTMPESTLKKEETRSDLLPPRTRDKRDGYDSHRQGAIGDEFERHPDQEFTRAAADESDPTNFVLTRPRGHDGEIKGPHHGHDGEIKGPHHGQDRYG